MAAKQPDKSYIARARRLHNAIEALVQEYATAPNTPGVRVMREGVLNFRNETWLKITLPVLKKQTLSERDGNAVVDRMGNLYQQYAASLEEFGAGR